MRVVVIGSVAAGTSVAAKARRNTENAEIVVYDQDKDISYSVCGIPYFVGEEVESIDKLTPRNAAWFKKRYNVDIFTEHRVTHIDPYKKELQMTNLQTGQAITDTYDVLVLATGAAPVTPEAFIDQKWDNVFQVRSIQNARSIRSYIEARQPKRAVILGAGFIGLEMAEQLFNEGIEVTLIQRGKQVMKHMDPDMAFRVEQLLRDKGIHVLLETTVAEVVGTPLVTAVKTNTGEIIDTDMVILATGVRPNTKLAKEAGITIGGTGAVQVDKKMRTNVSTIYAVGDVAESYSLITGKPIYRPLGSTANKMGRIAGDVITGGRLEHRGILGTGIVRVFDMAVAQTGLTEEEARKAGYDLAVLFNIKPDKADYLGGIELTIKAIADKATGRVLGAQITGINGVDKRIDVLATAISFKAKAEDLFHLDLAYAPPFATTKDPVLYTGMALDNALRRNPLITPEELIKKQQVNERLQIIDARSPKQYAASSVEGAINIPLADLREKAQTLDPSIPTITYCNKGVTGNAAQNILLNLGFKQVFNLSGGNKNYQMYRQLKK
ncbi:FAD-dependent oxidoreductase [Sporolactobacillus sp. STSJ-5]|uniref:FAD-dependent oxidoreductase n=1 Tax=Sporolactobacillus sp. STSJ-5 TaxID=2965076 RepID=UPI002107DBD4|nr:FAD-dependent oxidoreductase [Sporolactobacillus sp. STSJ-5]MCQ2010171.1 FAD-dependent oxidoreductase [Sporolactobacillus sp. STSJ-5]